MVKQRCGIIRVSILDLIIKIQQQLKTKQQKIRVIQNNKQVNSKIKLSKGHEE